MKHYTIQTLPAKKYLDFSLEEKKLYRHNLRRLKKGVIVPGLCITEGCNNIRYSLNENCIHCEPCKKRLLNEGSQRFQDEYKIKHGISYHKAALIAECEARGVVQERLEV